MAEVMPINAPRDDVGSPRTGTGILPCQAIQAMLRGGEILPTKELLKTNEIFSDQVQPSSIDLRLGYFAYRVPTSFLPGSELTVLQKMRQLDECFEDYKIDLEKGAVLEKGCVYVIPLLEELDLRSELLGFANPKSSTGRLDILTRLIADRSTAFDQVEGGYKGRLYLEVAPKSFSVVVKTGTRLNQLRFRRGQPSIKIDEWDDLLKKEQIVRSEDKERMPGKPGVLRFTIDLKGSGEGDLIGYRAKKHTDRIDVEKISYYDPRDFWEPIYFHRTARLILDPDEFYILVTKEAVGIPPDYAAEMVAYDTRAGEFRVHYAGFFDPGFGWDSATGKVGDSKAVLEVRSHEVPFLLEHGQTVGWLSYERMWASPPVDKLYGQSIKSNYQGQRLKLAKQFRPMVIE